MRELVAHLGLGIGLSRFVTTAADDAVPLTLAEYVRAYPPAADQIAADTRALTAARVIAENVRRGEAGEPFLHLVDRALGY